MWNIWVPNLDGLPILINEAKCKFQEPRDERFSGRWSESEQLRYIVLVKFSSDGGLEIHGNEITISIKSEPKHGRANNELVKKMANHFGVSTDHVRIVSGLMSRKKIVEVV